MDRENSRKRRRHSAEVKALIRTDCAMPGASVAKVAMVHGINANIVHGRRKLAREAGAVTVPQQFAPVAVATTAVPSADKQIIDVELRRGAVVMTVTWPAAATADLAAWKRELPRSSAPMIGVEAVWVAEEPLDCAPAPRGTGAHGHGVRRSTTAPCTFFRQSARQSHEDAGARRQANLPRRDVRHELENTTCGCGTEMHRIGEDVASTLDYQPGVFTVARHIRGKWVCKCCEKITHGPVAPHVIDKGLPTAGILAQVLVAKYLNPQPLYRHEAIF